VRFAVAGAAARAVSRHVGVVVLGACTATAAAASPASGADGGPANGRPPAAVAAPGIPATAWRADASRGTLTFRATQAGAAFEGRFARFVAQLAFAPGDRPSGRFDVAIDTGSVDTAERERDELLRSPEFFDATRLPEARYVATAFARLDGATYEARGQLTLRGVTRDVPLRFTWSGPAGAPVLAGTAMLRRLEFGVGQGEWRDTAWVGDEVRIAFDLRPAAATP
jgi:polyisoprenoid-binding protein YceI